MTTIADNEEREMSRIQLNDSVMDAVIKMVEGNPGALSALMDVMEKAERIDPQSAFGALGVILSLDTHQIYGSSIYVLWSDKCNRDCRRMLMLLRAVQLGLFPESQLQTMAADQARKINLTEEEFEALDKQVCEQLVDFARPASKAA
jgi:hypothetical protein